MQWMVESRRWGELSHAGGFSWTWWPPGWSLYNRARFFGSVSCSLGIVDISKNVIPCPTSSLFANSLYRCLDPEDTKLTNPTYERISQDRRLRLRRRDKQLVDTSMWPGGHCNF